MTRSTYRLVAVAAALLLAGCATAVPDVIRFPVAGPEFTAVKAAPAAKLGQRVRWGGIVAGVHNRAADTLIEVLETPLAENGRPSDDEGAIRGRFLARFPGFMDPATLEKGSPMTVVGTIEPPITRNIGEYPYTFPVVGAQHHYIWPQYKRPDREVYYILRDPWYPRYWSPYYPRRYYP